MKIILLPVFAVLLAAAGCRTKPLDPLAQGQADYQMLNCGSCHRIGEQGSRSGPDLSYVGFRKSPQWLDLWLKDPQAWKKNSLMPNFRLSDDVRQALVIYLSTLKGQAYAAEAPWNDPALIKNPVERGHILFNTVGCVTCHGVGGIGGYPNNNVAGGLIPSLKTVAASYTKKELIARISLGAQPAREDPNGPQPLLSMPTWGQTLKPDEIESLADYVLSFSPKTLSSF